LYDREDVNFMRMGINGRGTSSINGTDCDPRHSPRTNG